MRVAIIFCLTAAPVWAQSVEIGCGAEEDIASGAQLFVSPSGYDVRSEGALRIVGTSGSGNEARLLGPTAGVPIKVFSGGVIDMKFAKLENVTTLTIYAGGDLEQLRNTEFADLAGLSPGTIPWIDLSLTTSNSRHGIPFSFNLVTFTDPQGSPTRTNIKAGADTPVVTMLGDATNDGNRWGESFDDDPANRIAWATNVVKRYDGTTADSATFPTLDAALAHSGTTPSKRFKVEFSTPFVFIDENIDWSVYGSHVDSTGPKIELANVAPHSGLAFFNSASGTDKKGLLIRCAIARGGIARTTAKNCTIFDPLCAAMNVSDVAGTNLLIQQGFAGTGNTLLSTATTAVAQFFRDAARYDLHIRAPAAVATAVDEGSVQTYDENVDIDGESFGFDGKTGGVSGNWDRGADEMIFVDAPALSVSARTTTSITWAISTVANEAGFHFFPAAHAFGESGATNLAANTTSYAESGLTENQPVTRHVHGYTVVGDWDPSSDVTAHAAIRDASTSDFALSGGVSSVWITVTSPPNSASAQTGVKIERSPNGSTGWVTVQDFAATYAKNDTGLAAQTWYYRITYRNGDAVATTTSGNNSVVVAAGLSAPTIDSSSGRKTNDNTPIITGTHATNGATIRVWIGGTSVGTTTVASGAWSIHNTSTVIADGTYGIVARQESAGQYSDASNTVTVTVDTVAPDAPAGVAVVQLSGKVIVQWRASAASDLRGYNVYRRPTGGGGWGSPLNGASTPVRKDQIQWCDDTAVNGTTYDYKVTAVDDAKNEKHP